MNHLFLYNTLKRKKERFAPRDPQRVTLYTCGPTVYHYVHLGNWRTFLAVDLLKRVLTSLHYRVDDVINITDVGHLSEGEGEMGEDRIEEAATREGKSPQAVAAFYSRSFLDDLKALAILPPTDLPRATEHIPEMITMVRALLDKGVAYETATAVYFAVAKFPPYHELSGQRVGEKIQAARQEVVLDRHKRHPADFVLWFKAVGKFAHHGQVWDSPWGKGFPGWHIECSAMARHHLGDSIDIHAGGVDLIGTHHTNEIAQSETVTGQPFVRFWFHPEHLLVDEAKMARSEGSGIRLSELATHGFNPASFRYLMLMTHYRTKAHFSWPALAGGQKTLEAIRQLVARGGTDSVDKATKAEAWETLLDDLDTPRLLASLHRAKSPALWQEFAFVLGLDFSPPPAPPDHSLPSSVGDLMAERDKARAAGDWARADTLRRAIAKRGYRVVDTKEGSHLEPSSLTLP